MTAELGIFMELLVADGNKLELFHTGGEQMLSAALNLWVHYFCHPLNSLMSRMPPKVKVVSLREHYTQFVNGIVILLCVLFT